MDEEPTVADLCLASQLNSVRFATTAVKSGGGAVFSRNDAEGEGNLFVALQSSRAVNVPSGRHGVAMPKQRNIQMLRWLGTPASLGRQTTASTLVITSLAIAGVGAPTSGNAQIDPTQWRGHLNSSCVRTSSVTYRFGPV